MLTVFIKYITEALLNPLQKVQTYRKKIKILPPRNNDCVNIN